MLKIPCYQTFFKENLKSIALNHEHFVSNFRMHEGIFSMLLYREMCIIFKEFVFVGACSIKNVYYKRSHFFEH